MEQRPSVYRQSPYYRDVGAGRVKSLQILLLTIGGVLILFGVLRGVMSGQMAAGYVAINEGDYERAAKLFLADVKSNPESVPSRIGYTLALLGEKRIEEAEQQWQWLLEPKPSKHADAARANGIVITSQEYRLDAFRRNDPRAGRNYEGEILWADAWLLGEITIKSYRRNAPRREQLEWKSRHDSAVNRFRLYVNRREGELAVPVEPNAEPSRKNPFGDKIGENDSASGNTAGLWNRRLKAVTDLLKNAERTSDLSLGLAILEAKSPVPAEPTSHKPPRHDIAKIPTDVLQASLERHLNAAKGYIPTDLIAHTWWIQVMAELASRGERVSRGVIPKDGIPGENGMPERHPAYEALEDDITALLEGPETKLDGLGAYSKEELLREPMAAARLRFGVAKAALALRERHRGSLARIAELELVAETQAARGREIKREFRESHPEYGDLAALEDRVNDLARKSFRGE